MKDSLVRTWTEFGWSINEQIPRWKRMMDVGIIILLLPALIPLMGLIALAIKFASPGPVLFRQERIGFLGNPFTLLKFRSMHVGSDTSLHEQYLGKLIQSNAPMRKMDQKGDPRIIPLGRLFRASGLDELPQLINVLQGEMSLVGPRPCTPYEFEQYLPWQLERFKTLPGLTGLWQVRGKNKTTFTEMIKMDVTYVRERSPWMDLKILFKTVTTISKQVKEMNQNLPPQGKEDRGHSSMDDAGH